MSSALPSIRQMQAYIAVARLGSFSRAASQLGLSQPALSQAIRQLEFLLQARLLERGKQAVRVTPAGEEFLQRAEGLLGQLDEAVVAVRRETEQDRGSVSVACLSTVATLLIPRVVRRFKARFPKVSISIRDEHVDGILDQVKAGEVDFAISCLFSDDADIAFEPVIHDRFRFVCHRGHPLAGRRSVQWSELRDVEIVTTTKGSGVRSLIERALPDAGVFDHALYEVSRIPSVLDIVEEGGLASVLPALTLAAVPPDGPLVHCPVLGPEVRRAVGFLCARDAPLSTLATRFRDCFLETLHDEGLLAGVPDVRLAPLPRGWAAA